MSVMAHLRRGFRCSRRPAGPSVRARRPLTVEALEERLVPDATGFVRGLYHDLLHRTPQEAEVDGWVQHLDAGVSHDAVVAAFTSSDEYRLSGIREDYGLLLGRAPKPDEEDLWLKGLKNGLTPSQVQQAILASDEYYLQHGSNTEDWLKGLYHGVLGRQDDDDGLTGWEQTIQEDSVSRLVVAAGFVESTEHHTLQVDQAYRDLLGREADADGESVFVDAMDQGLQDDAVRAKIAASQEYDDLHDSTVAVQATTPFGLWTDISAAIGMVPESVGVIHDANGIPANVQIVNFGSTVYDGPLDIKSTLDRIRGDTMLPHNNDGSVFTNLQGILPCNPYDGYWHEFVVWPYSVTDSPSGVTFPGPMRVLLGAKGEVYFTGDHYATAVQVN
jgi:guanyl-specific ribonuclease Sa